MIDPYFDRLQSTIYNADSLDILPNIAGATIVVADPPFTFGLGSSIHQSGKIGGWGDLMNNARWYASWINIGLIVEAIQNNAL